MSAYTKEGMSPQRPKVALVSIGIGQTQRGYERFFSDLFSVLRDDVDITLYKGAGGRVDRERIPRLLAPAKFGSRLLPFGVVVGGAEYRYYKHDCVAYGLALLPELIARRFDVVHVIDYPLMRVLEKLKRTVGFPGDLLYTNGCNMPPQLYPRVSHVHHVAQPLYQEALQWGVPDSRMTLATCGIHVNRFVTQATREELRNKYHIPQDKFVVLAVTAVKRMHKRVDHLIEEVSKVDGNLLFLIDGHPEDSSIPELARERLGERCRIDRVPSSAVGELYKIADVLVHGSLEESFGLAIVEALSTGLPVLVHDSPHFQWLVQERDCLVDMQTSGMLASRLRGLYAHRDQIRPSSIRAARARQRFDWSNVKAAYLNMYCQLAGMTTLAKAEVCAS